VELLRGNRKGLIAEHPVLGAAALLAVIVLWLVGAHLTSASDHKTAATHLDRSCADIAQIIDNPQMGTSQANPKVDDALSNAQSAANADSEYRPFLVDMRQARSDIVDDDPQAALSVLENVLSTCK
jgi:hypothetical protein